MNPSLNQLQIAELGRSARFTPVPAALTCPEGVCAWSTLAVTKLKRRENQQQSKGASLPRSCWPLRQQVPGAAPCPEELDADGPVPPGGSAGPSPAEGCKAAGRTTERGGRRLAAPAGVSGASSKVALINEHMCSEESHSIPLKLLTWSRFWRQPYSAH